jgi:hydroxymethyl cephem carbamoyltransferase
MSLSILSYKPPHDGTIAYIEDGALKFSVEGEKDSWPRHAGMNSLYRALRIMGRCGVRPDVFAWGGGSPAADPEDLYNGTSPDIISTETIQLFGQPLLCFRSSHERAHIFCSYGLSPFPQGQPVYALVWEGGIGSFYEIDEKMNIQKFETVLSDPGVRYSYPYTLANPRNPKTSSSWYLNSSEAGKMMALASYGEIMGAEKRKDWTAEIERILKIKMAYDFPDPRRPWEKKNIASFLQELKQSPLLDIGVESDDFKDFSLALSDAIFDRFYQFAKKNLAKGYPLLISGGCGLNCDWNTRWKESGLFADVFVPPCPNDSGIAIGMAVDAQRQVAGQAKISWSVYCGEEFIEDTADTSGFALSALNLDEVAAHLEEGKVFAWVEGKYEIGPRALCHRSLIAAPFKKEMTDRLNEIKKREKFRPIAPVCPEEEVSDYFDWKGPSPYMLYFQRVKTDRLQAVTHVNHTARLQTVNDQDNPKMSALLLAFKKRTGFAVLCNTSLNFPSMGFINRLSDLVKYARQTGLDGFVVGDKFYIRKAFDYRRMDSVKPLPPSRLYLDLNRPVTVFPLTHRDKITTEFSGGAVILKYDSELDTCIFSCPSNQEPFAAPGVVDLRGYHFFRFQALATPDLGFFVSMTESGANHPDSPSFSGVNGADGERYYFPTLRGTGRWETYQVDLSTLRRWGYWGNQKGNQILDLQGLRSVEFFMLGRQKGELRLKDLEFTLE